VALQAAVEHLEATTGRDHPHVIAARALLDQARDTATDPQASTRVR
jgi:hypothetical protein